MGQLENCSEKRMTEIERYKIALREQIKIYESNVEVTANTFAPVLSFKPSEEPLGAKAECSAETSLGKFLSECATDLRRLNDRLNEINGASEL